MTDFDELERLLREATRGPWSSTPSIPEQGYECFWITACPEINQEREVATVCGPQTERNTANAALIAALRNSAEELIRDARRLEWAQRNVTMIDVVSDPDNVVGVWYSPGERRASGRTIREAIDAAIAKGGE